MTSATFGTGLDYMNISISWNSDNAVLGQHSCAAWLDVVTDGCSIPNPAGGANFKHGGSVGWNTPYVNATLNIEPLVMREIFHLGTADFHQCNGVDTNKYVDQQTLQSNIDDYCIKSANQSVAESGSTFEQTYNDGTPDRVTLSTEWPKGAWNYEVFKDECTYYLGVLK